MLKKTHFQNTAHSFEEKKERGANHPLKCFFFCGKMIRGFCGRRWGGNKRHIKPTFKGG